MPHDFGSFGSRDRRSGPAPASGIGFHELRQACEISTLREDLERLAHEAGTLRDGVEAAVEDIRDRFAALSAEQMADAAAMAPLLQAAVTTLLDIREQARRLNTRTGPLPDDDRSTWLAAADAPRVRPGPAAPCAPAPPAAPSAAPHAPEDEAPPLRPTPSIAAPLPPLKAPPEPAPVAASPPPAAPAASWLASRSAPLPPSPPSRAATARNGGPSSPKPGGIDWLGPAGR